jgi:hypothetical protein
MATSTPARAGERSKTVRSTCPLDSSMTTAGTDHGGSLETARVLRFCPPEMGVLLAKQKHVSGRKKMDQRRSR